MCRRLLLLYLPRHERASTILLLQQRAAIHWRPHPSSSVRHGENSWNHTIRTSINLHGKESKSRFLPTYKDEPTRKAELDRRRHRKEVEKYAKEAFRGLLFPFGMMGKAIASTVAKTVSKEGRRLDKVLNQAQRLIRKDKRAVAELSEPVVVGSEFSQSRSTITVNGKKTEVVQASFSSVGFSAERNRNFDC
mgnify:CR=1 FL=1